VSDNNDENKNTSSIPGLELETETPSNESETATASSTQTETPTREKIELPAESNEQETKIVSSQADPSIFDTATVIKPSDVSASEVTRYFKEIKSKSSLEDLKLSGSLSPFPDKNSERRKSEAERRRQQGEFKGESKRRSDRRSYSDEKTSEFRKTWMWGAGALVFFIVIFVVSSLRHTSLQPTENIQMSQSARPANPTDDTVSQLKVEFLSDLHKNIEATKAHAPLY